MPQARPTSSRNSKLIFKGVFNSGVNNNFFYVIDQSMPHLDQMRQMLMADPTQFEVLRQRFPELASAIQRNDTGMYCIKFIPDCVF